MKRVLIENTYGGSRRSSKDDSLSHSNRGLSLYQGTKTIRGSGLVRIEQANKTNGLKDDDYCVPWFIPVSGVKEK